MITYKQLIWQKFLKIAKINSTTTNISFFRFLTKPLTLMKSDTPDEDKSLTDSKALLPVLIDFFQKHPLINPKTFLGDAAFDAIKIYKSLFEEIGFQKSFYSFETKAFCGRY